MIRTLIFSILITISLNANAFKLYKTQDGHLVRWAKSEVEVQLDSSLASIGPMDKVEATIKKGFTAWVQSSEMPVDFVFNRADCAASHNSNVNCLMACDSPKTCKAGKEEKGATTYLQVAPNGEIRGADIVYNASTWQWDVNSETGEGLNLARVTAHEAGHFVGIDHSDEPDALMYWSMSHNDTSEPTLHQDDKMAVVNLYDGFTGDDVDPASCSTTIVASPGRSEWGTILFLILGVIIAIKRQGRRENR